MVHCTDWARASPLSTVRSVGLLAYSRSTAARRPPPLWRHRFPPVSLRPGRRSVPDGWLDCTPWRGYAAVTLGPGCSPAPRRRFWMTPRESSLPRATTRAAWTGKGRRSGARWRRLSEAKLSQTRRVFSARSPLRGWLEALVRLVGAHRRAPVGPGGCAGSQYGRTQRSAPTVADVGPRGFRHGFSLGGTYGKP